MVTYGQASSVLETPIPTIKRWHLRGLIKLDQEWLVDFVKDRQEYLCRKCAHEWLNKKPWDPKRCPSCNSSRIAQIERVNDSDVPGDRLPISISEAVRILKTSQKTIRTWIARGWLQKPLTREQIELFKATHSHDYLCMKCGKEWTRRKPGDPYQCYSCKSTRIIRK